MILLPFFFVWLASGNICVERSLQVIIDEIYSICKLRWTFPRNDGLSTADACQRSSFRWAFNAAISLLAKPKPTASAGSKPASVRSTCRWANHCWTIFDSNEPIALHSLSKFQLFSRIQQPYAISVRRKWWRSQAVFRQKIQHQRTAGHPAIWKRQFKLARKHSNDSSPGLTTNFHFGIES